LCRPEVGLSLAKEQQSMASLELGFNLVKMPIEQGFRCKWFG
jgi:hypothetical protein